METTVTLQQIKDAEEAMLRALAWRASARVETDRLTARIKSLETERYRQEQVLVQACKEASTALDTLNRLRLEYAASLHSEWSPKED